MRFPGCHGPAVPHRLCAGTGHVAAIGRDAGRDSRTHGPRRPRSTSPATLNLAPRIHGELLKLGFRVSERTVSRYVRAVRPRRPAGTSWKTFLDDHREVLAAIDEMDSSWRL